MAVNRAGTVGFLKSLEVPALDNAGGSFTLAGAGYVDALALGENVGLDEVAYISFHTVETEFAEILFGSDVILLEMTGHRLVNVALTSPKPY